MKTTRWLPVLPFVALLWSAAMVFTPIAGAQTIRALLVGNNENVPAYGKNMELIVGLLRAIGTQEVCTVNNTLRIDYATADVTPASEQTQQWFENVRPGGNDVVFVYYSRDDRGSDDSLDPEELASKLGKLPGRLKILITDSDFHRVENTGGTTGNDTPDVSKSVLENLFVQHKGFLHLTSKSEDEFAFGDANGGWFTQALVDAIYAAPTNEDSIVTWEDVLGTTREGTKRLYTENADNFSDELKRMMDATGINEHQTPISLSDFPTFASTVHALLVIDDTADAGENSVSAINHIRVRGLLRGAQELGICNLRLESLRRSENNVTPDKIKEWAETTISPLENDTVFVYYSANDGPAAANQREILKALEKAITGARAKQSRLQMFIVDTYRLGPAILIPRFGLPYPQTTFHNLFLEHKGFLHFVSKSEDEFAFGDGSDGGWFTRALIESIYEIRKREDFPPQVPNNGRDRKFLEWKELVKKTGEKIRDEFFDKRYPEGFEDAENYPETFSEAARQKLLEELDDAKKSQTPEAHKLPKRERID